MQIQIIHAILLICVFCTSCCTPDCNTIEPHISYCTPTRLVERLPSPFTPLSPSERAQDWGKELALGRAFSKELDLYRALTCFKRAQFLIPAKERQRKTEIEYDIFFAYYVGNKFEDALEIFENGELAYADANFPAYNDLLIAVYDAYMQIDEPDKAYRIMCLISMINQEVSTKLELESAFLEANIPLMEQIAENVPFSDSIFGFVANYSCNAKSIQKARTLNTVFPGAGYWYVGQKKTAVTSFIINALFIAAAYQLFDRGYIAGGLILTSLETGWYFGGINGAGLAAKEYNEHLYNCLAKETMVQNRLFPILMIERGF